jgi:hypothetical protein
VERELIAVLTSQDFIAYLGDQISQLRRKPPPTLVGQCSNLLQDSIRIYQFPRHEVVTDAKVFE